MAKLFLVVLFLGLCGANAAAISTSTQDEASVALRDSIKVIQGLRDRRLFDLAEIYTQQQLSSASLDVVDKASIVMEQIQTSVAKAIVATGDDRKSAWNEAHAAASYFATEYPEHPQAMLVQVQDALVYFSNGNLIQQEIAAEIAPPGTSGAALAQFRQATSAFNSIEREIEKQLPDVRNRTPVAGELTAEELFNLKSNIRYRLATINLAKAQLYDASDRLNQLDALNQVLSRLDQVITQSNAEVPLWWKAQIARATCIRLKKDPVAFKRLISTLPRNEISADLQNDFLVQRILAAIDFQQNDQFAELLQAFAQAENPSAQLQLAGLQMIMFQAAQLPDAQKKRKQADATNLVNVIESTHGPYWGRRAEVLLVGSVSATGNVGEATASSDLEILVRQGESAFRKKNFSDAAKAFDKALRFAAGGSDGEMALQLAVRLAGCFESLNQHQQAAGHLLSVSNQFRQSPSADAVHLRGCWNLAQGGETHESELVDALQAHASIWPDSTSTHQALLWLGSAYQKDKRWSQAIAAYNSIPFSSQHVVAAIGQMEPCATQLMNQAKQTGEDPANVARNLVSLFQDRLQQPKSKKNWNGVQRQLLASMIAIGWSARVIRADEALAWLESAQQGEAVSQMWRIESKIIRLIASCMKPGASDPNEVVKSLPNDATVMSQCYGRLHQTLDEQQFDQISDTRIIICDKALADENAPDKEFWQIEKLVAQVAGADASDSLSELKSFADKYPKSLKIQLAYSRELTKSSNSPQEVLKQWRRLAAKVPKESESWYEAKLNVVIQMIKNDQRAEAQKLVKYLEVSTPSWQQSEWKVRFENAVK